MHAEILSDVEDMPPARAPPSSSWPAPLGACRLSDSHIELYLFKQVTKPSSRESPNPRRRPSNRTSPACIESRETKSHIRFLGSKAFRPAVFQSLVKSCLGLLGLGGSFIHIYIYMWVRVCISIYLFVYTHGLRDFRACIRLACTCVCVCACVLLFTYSCSTLEHGVSMSETA